MGNNVKYKVCVLAAGVGSRMGSLSDNIHKAILPVNFKAVISYIVEKFPKNIEIVVAVGHKKDTVKNYLALAHPERKFTFVEVNKYSGPSTGPGYSLLKCRNRLKCPFIFFAADTIVLEDIPMPDHNWFGIAPVKDPEQYCTVRIKNNLIYHLDVKVKNNNRFAFIGLAGIRDYDVFFRALSANNKTTKEEIQVTNGFEKLIEKEKAARPATHGLETARDRFIESAGKISANMLGMVSKVGGQIYALLFIARNPMSLDEIAEVLIVPLETFADPTKVRVEERDRDGERVQLLFYQHETHEIWGATARILRNFLDSVFGPRA